MKSYVIYGLSGQVSELLQRLGCAFGIELVAHESTYRGVYYHYGPLGKEHFLLQPNYLAHEDEWIEEKHREFPLLLYVNETTRPDEIDALLLQEIPSAEKLKHEVL